MPESQNAQWRQFEPEEDLGRRAWRTGLELYPLHRGPSGHQRLLADFTLFGCAGSFAGVDRIDLRRLRRTCATYLRNESIAQGQLRHSSVETTKRHYLKSIPAEQQARVEQLDRELFGAGKVVQIRRRKRPA